MYSRNRVKFRLITGLLALMLTSFPLTASESQPKIMTSLHPLAFIAAEVAGDQAEISVLVPAGASPHTYSMRPSERRQLEEADHFLWVGPGMETFLERLLQQPSLKSKSIALGESLTNGKHDHEHSHDHEGHDKVVRASDSDTDPHVWLSPGLARSMAERLVAYLSEADGFDAQQLEANLERFRQELDETIERLQKELEPARSLSIFTYHDAFRHFADYFALNVAGNLTVNPERNPGARRLSELREHLRDAPSPCVMTEPQFRSSWWDNLANDIELGVSTWDPLGQSIEPAAGSYLQLMDSLGEAVKACVRN